MAKYYDVSTDEEKEVTQEWVKEVQNIQHITYKRNAIIKAVSNLHIINEKLLINQLAEILKV